MSRAQSKYYHVISDVISLGRECGSVAQALLRADFRATTVEQSCPLLVYVPRSRLPVARRIYTAFIAVSLFGLKGAVCDSYGSH